MMNELSYLEKLSPYPIYIHGIGFFKPHTIQEIIKMGEDKYIQYLSYLVSDMQTLLSIMGIDSEYNNLSDNDKADIDIFDLWTINEDNVFTFVDLLSFFIDDTLIFDFETKQVVVFETIDGIDKIIGYINKSNFEKAQYVIKQLHSLQSNKMLEGKPKNKLAAKLLARFKKHNQEIKSKGDEQLELGNMISAVSVQHNSYNLTNIWSLTVNQLYDQFFRLNTKTQIDTIATRWAFAGKDSFDFSLWYKKEK